MSAELDATATAATPAPEQKKPLQILLLTNRDSDNVGDQVIETTDISLVKTAMANLGYAPGEFKVVSRAAAIVPKAYLASKDPALLETAHRVIGKCDLVLFGGAPLFNYAYQDFYERTAVTVEIAAQHGKPVVFSGIGVEGYSRTNPKCQRLKKALLGGNVKQITTRDGFENLKGYTAGSSIAIGKVADPAVFTSQIFRTHTAQVEKKPKTVGIFVLRANGFKDNGGDFSKEDAAQLWLDLIAELQARGYDYELLTSGHFGDEAFLDYMIREKRVPSSKCVFNMNSPEALVKKVAGYEGVVSTRLHPNIIAYSLKVPTVGVIWNTKVSRFYDSVGYPNRYLHVEGISAAAIVDRLEAAMVEGVEHTPDYMITVYQTLLEGLRASFCPENPAQPYGFEQLCRELVPFEGTSAREQQLKLERKFRRSYSKYNDLWDKYRELCSVVAAAQEQAKADAGVLKRVKRKLRAIVKPALEPKPEDLKVPVFYYTLPENKEAVTFVPGEVQGELVRHESGSYEVKSTNIFAQDKGCFPRKVFEREGFTLKGWVVRIRLADHWLWYMADGSIALKGRMNSDAFDNEKALFAPGAPAPVLKMEDVKAVVVEAVWE